MFDTQVTLQGWVGGPVTIRDAGGVPVASFRVASTPRRFSRRTEEWADGETQWFTVKAWRGLGDNCSRSLRRGDPVVVQGRLEARTYVNGNEVQVTDFEIEASAVGHDLTRGTSSFARTQRTEPLRAVPTGDSDAERPAEPGADPSASSAVGPVAGPAAGPVADVG